ncbi:N-acetylmuramoyl-L-alanine amidase [Nocardioides litoris]|uniref:N-acetylmuramoyl-L-alanine amidase n=1 Tax=Nocardioides litoris TaxID=1926648 RepID=UPI00111F8F45|nr:N-acetylmuramoyl-L-alanine amidase [Nocardioides litoris]
MPTHVRRRHFLLASGAGTALALAAPGSAGAGTATSRVRVDAHPVFDGAGRAHGVPPALLAALSHAQTRWADQAGRPSSSLGYGPMHLVDGAAATEARARVGKDDPAPVVDTLREAAAAAGLDIEEVRRDADANVRAAAALLATRQRAAGHPVGVGTDPAQWYDAVAATSGMTTAAAQLDLADTVLATVRDGARVETADGARFFVPARRTGRPGAQRTALHRRAKAARRAGAVRGREAEAPRGLDVEWIPAPYEQYGPGAGDYGNHDLADRPQAPTISHVVIHDTEGYWDTVLDLVSDPTYVSWQYSLRSEDGHIAQHAKARDVCWHAGNWWMNMHSIGLEHEGFAAQGAPWFSEAMYRTSARLVRYLAKQHRIPLDRAHVIGHDQVPGTTTPTIPGMHWDPGPFWDWEHYFELLGAPLRRGTSGRRPQVGDVVRVLPGFAGNVQPVTGCETAGDTCGAPRETNFVTVRTEPADDAPLVNDPGLHQQGQPATTEVSDISARATAGTEYVVAAVEGDWTAVWFLGVQGWIANPRRRPTLRVVQHPVGRVRARGASAKTYGRCYPEAAAYANPADVQTVSPLLYTLPAGQLYAVGDLAPVTDYYKAKTFSPDTPGDHVDIVGRDEYVQINLGHRIAFVRREEVEVLR